MSGHYQIGNDQAFKASPLTISRNRYGADLTLSAPVTDWMTGSLSVGYSNDSVLRDAKALASDAPEFRVGVRFTIRSEDGKSRVAGRYDSLYKDSNLNASWAEQKGNQRWDAAADLSKYGTGDNATGSASVGYAGNRGEARITQTAGMSGNIADGARYDNRTSVRGGAAIAFAGDKVAVGAPVRGNGFAIVAPHESIGDRTMTIGDKEQPRAVSDGFGPALVSNLPAYAVTNLPVDVDNLPTGYSLGKGGFDLKAPYRAGYALEVGSANSVSAYGTLHDASGLPIAFLTGIAKPAEGPQRHVTIFTNATGRFGAEGLSPGRWTIEMATEGVPTVFAMDVPKGTDGLFKTGTLTPQGARPKDMQ